MHARGERGRMGVQDASRAVGPSRGRDDECGVARCRVVRRRLLRQALCLPGRGLHREHRRRARAAGDLELGSPRSDDDSRAGRRDPDVERRRGEALRRGNQDRADLDPGEHDLGPVRRRAREHEHAIARSHAGFAEERRPTRCAVGQLRERARLDDHVVPEVRERAPLLILCERLDDVAREVEPRRDVPATVRQRGRERRLDRADGLWARRRLTARAEQKGLHGLLVIGIAARAWDRRTSDPVPA